MKQLYFFCFKQYWINENNLFFLKCPTTIKKVLFHNTGIQSTNTRYKIIIQDNIIKSYNTYRQNVKRMYITNDLEINVPL